MENEDFLVVVNDSAYLVRGDDYKVQHEVVGIGISYHIEAMENGIDFALSQAMNTGDKDAVVRECELGMVIKSVKVYRFIK